MAERRRLRDPKGFCEVCGYHSRLSSSDGTRCLFCDVEDDDFHDNHEVEECKSGNELISKMLKRVTTIRRVLEEYFRDKEIDKEELLIYIHRLTQGFDNLARFDAREDGKELELAKRILQEREREKAEKGPWDLEEDETGWNSQETVYHARTVDTPGVYFD